MRDSRALVFSFFFVKGEGKWEGERVVETHLDLRISFLSRCGLIGI